MSQMNHKNFGYQIVAARGVKDLSRAELAKLARLGHPVVKQAEIGDPSVPEEALVKICRALETLGFEFPHGTSDVALVFHGPDRTDFAVTVDPTMPGMIRRIYPRQLDVHDLVRDLETCGIVIENADRAIGLFLEQSQGLGEYVPLLAESGREFGIRFRWRGSVRNVEGVTHALATYYGFSDEAIARVLNNVMGDAREA